MKKLTFSSILLGLFLSLFVMTPSFAQGELLNAVAQTASLSTAPIENVIGNIINQVLTIIGVILLVIVIYAGVLWATAGGNAEQVKKAKAWMINAVIGLIIVFSAYAITEFVFQVAGIT